jgi:hypothetical protein
VEPIPLGVVPSHGVDSFRKHVGVFSPASRALCYHAWAWTFDGVQIRPAEGLHGPATPPRTVPRPMAPMTGARRPLKDRSAGTTATPRDRRTGRLGKRATAARGTSMPRVVSPGLSASHNNQTRLCVTTRPFGGTPYSPPSGLSLRSSEQWLEISATWAQNTGTEHPGHQSCPRRRSGLPRPSAGPVGFGTMSERKLKLRLQGIAKRYQPGGRR